MRGRVMALYLVIFQGGTPLGAPVVGWVGHTFGARWTLIGGGAITIVGIGVAVAVYSLHRRCARARAVLGARRTARPAVQWGAVNPRYRRMVIPAALVGCS